MVSRIIRAFVLFLFAMIGVVIILLETEIPAETLERTGLSEQTLLIASLAQNAVIVGVAVLMGALTAHRVGLVSLIAHRAEGAGRKLAAFPLYAVIGVIFGLATAAADVWAFANIEALKPIAEMSAVEWTPYSPAVRFLYGGVTEEVLLRWGVLSLIAWLIWAPTKNRMLALWIALPLAALLFGVGHLPQFYQTLDVVPTALIVRTILLNAAAGIVLGIAYARNSLEAAMIMHATFHVGLLSAMNFMTAS